MLNILAIQTRHASLLYKRITLQNYLYRILCFKQDILRKVQLF